MSTNEKPVLHRAFPEVPLEEKAGRILEGCIVPYGEATKVRDGDGPTYWEVFQYGAFDKQVPAVNRLPRLRFEHRDEIFHRIGKCIRMKEEEHGLFGEFEIYSGDYGDQALELVRHGEMTGFSVGFSDKYTNWKRTAEGTVVREKCVLHEVSLVEHPAYANALVTAHRSRAELLGDIEIPDVTDEQLERLRAVGISV